ncbi:ComF family protein [Azospirillum halopraeferens]|uniref:ComF family protein n=1 Tax=Azospirillum halopraeferens TaxID=34010 RepID=UPI0004047282|nr:ComF family protein [Azospirillum halopraeferens]
MGAAAELRRLAGAALDALLPPRCLSCGTGVDRQGGLCPSCWAGLTFIAAPLCACCGLPFEYAVPGETLCGACIADPPLFARARSVLVYDDASRPLVLGFKHGDRTHAAGPFGAWMARAGADVLAGADLLVPVPLHRWRLFARRYNQSALLALAVARLSGVAAAPDLLVRRRRTRSQGGLDRTGRQRNVAGAFALRPGRADRVAGRTVVLVDDVLTTGATLSECARVLLRAGAARVEVLTLARVIKG